MNHDLSSDTSEKKHGGFYGTSLNLSRAFHKKNFKALKNAKKNSNC